MTTALFTHAVCGAHETPPGHPESRDRWSAVTQGLEAAEFETLTRVEAPLASWEALGAAHTEDHVALVRDAAPETGLAQLDPDTFLGPHSLEAGRRAAGAVIAAVDGIVEKRFQNAFCAVRPPGHHAEPNRAMGFCLFNSVVVGALHARAVHGLRRVAVVDFDVHHGNGTQAAFWRDEDAFFGSTHEAPPQYPGAGFAHETGEGGTIVNRPLPSGAGGRDFRRAWEDVLGALDAFAPDIVIVSAGFDAHAHDPLGGLELNEDDFAWATAETAALARRHCDGRIVSSLEGGYDLAALAASARAHVAALTEAA